MNTRTAIALQRWHHGESNDLECYNDAGCAFQMTGVSDHTALMKARQHIRETGHHVEQSRTIFRFVYQPKPVPA